MDYESMIIFVIFLRATKRRRMETNFNTSETYCDDILVNNEKRSKLNDNKTNLSNLTEDKSFEDFLLDQPTNFNLFSFISADNQETGLGKSDNLILDDNFSLTEDLQEFISNECNFFFNLLNQCNSNSEDNIDLTKEQPEPSNEPEVIVIDSESKEENQSISSDSLDLGNDFIKKVVNMQSESENPLLDLGNDVLFSDVLNTHKKDDLCEELFKINNFSNKKECYHSKYENQPDLQNQKVAHQNLSVVNDGLSNSVSQDLEKILDECINDKSLRIEESESEKNDINQTRNFSDLINDQRSIFLDESLSSQDTSMGNENVNDSFTNHKKIIPLTIEQNSSDSLNLLESLSEALSSTVNQTILLENPEDINKCESDFYNKMVRFNSNKMIGLFEDDGHPFEIGLGIPIRPGLVIYRIEKRTPFRFYLVSRYFMDDSTIPKKFWLNQKNKPSFVQKMLEVLKAICLDISFINLVEDNLFSDISHNFILTSQRNTEKQTVLELVKLFNRFIETYFSFLKTEDGVLLSLVTRKIETCHKKNKNLTCSQIFQYVLDRCFKSENYEKIFLIIPELKHFYEIFTKNIVNIYEMRVVYYILEYVLFKFEFLKGNILFEIMKNKNDLTKSNTLNSFLLGTKVLILLAMYNTFTDKVYDSLILQSTISSFFIFLRIFNSNYANMFVLNDVYLLNNMFPPDFYSSFEVEGAVYCGTRRILGIKTPVSMNLKSFIYLKNNKSIFELLYESIGCENKRKDLEECMKNKEMFFTKEKFGEECLFYKNLLKSTTEKFILLLNK